MNLYKIQRTDTVGYDEYIAFVICADSEKEALSICNHIAREADYWPSDRQLTIQNIGIASCDLNKGVVLDSFNAG